MKVNRNPSFAIPASALACLTFCIGCPSRPVGDDPFPALSGWSKKGQPSLYTPDNLYQYVDGAAESFLAYQFQQLAVQTYQNSQQKTFTVEWYRHGSPLDAFGIYASEKPTEGDSLAIGAEGYREEGVLNFFHGRSYVKINGHGLDKSEQAILQVAATRIVESLGKQPGLPAELALFPRTGRIAHSERFIQKDFLGHSFLHSGLVADYQTAAKRFQLFLILGKDRVDAYQMMQRWVELTTKRKVDVLQKSYTLTDPDNGTLLVEYQDSRFLWGAVPDPGASGDTVLRSFRETASNWKGE